MHKLTDGVLVEEISALIFEFQTYFFVDMKYFDFHLYLSVPSLDRGYEGEENYTFVGLLFLLF